MMQHDIYVDASLDQAPLVVIDMQEVFRDSASDWQVPGYASAAAQVSQLTPHFGHNTIWTRFVRDPAEPGSWSAYYERWPSCRYEVDASAWVLTENSSVDGAVISASTFSKWGEELKAFTADSEYLVVCGVATDCCVLSTVLAAVDAGKHVVVVADACAGLTAEAHQQALDLMHLLYPMVMITETTPLLEAEIKVGNKQNPHLNTQQYES